MASPYASPTVVRQLATAITTDVISDVDVEAVSTNLVDPEIDGELAGFGAPFTGTTPAIVVAIASLMAVAVIFDDRYYQTAEESDWGRKKTDRAYKMLDRIKKGQSLPAGLTAPSGLLISDETLPHPESHVFVGSDDTGWEPRVETKE